jgi:hypothetical protein
MHRQILDRFDRNMGKISAFWDRPSSDRDSRTFDFCRQCESAFRAAEATRLQAEKRQMLLDGIVERMTRHGGLIDAGDTLSAVFQLARGADISYVRWPARRSDA